MFKDDEKNTQSNIQVLIKEFPILSNLEVHQCSTIKYQLSYESVQTGVTIKYQSFKDRQSHLILTPTSNSCPFAFF